MAARSRKLALPLALLVLLLTSTGAGQSEPERLYRARTWRQVCQQKVGPLKAPPGARWVGIRCQNTSSAPVYVGGDELTTETGWPICADATQCASAQVELFVTQLSCIAPQPQAVRCMVWE